MSTQVIATPGSVQRDLDKTSGKPRRSDPGSSTATHEKVAQLAYSLWQQRGCSEGSAEEDWFEAEQQLRSNAKRLRS